MKKFINDPFDAVDEMLEGYLLVNGKYLRRLEKARTVVSTAAPRQGKVGIVTGGGSGHKPAFLGFIGKGMLDAVTIGDIFTSPPPTAVYEGAKAVNGGKGVLFLLGNYSGDVMNFDMAAEMARAEGIEVEQVIATDDVGSAPPTEIEKRRGVVGEFLTWKMAGAKAETGASLAEVAEIARRVNDNTRSLGVALTGCTIPASGKPTFVLPEDEIEFGVGHHGEPGNKRMKMLPADEVSEIMVKQILEDLPFKSGDEVAVIINGLGGTPDLELYIMYRKVHQLLQDAGIKIYRSYVGEFFTALDMQGASITLTRLDEEMKQLLDAPADTPAFKQL